MQAGDPADVGLELADGGWVEAAQAPHAVRPRPALELVEAGQLGALGGDDHLAAALVGDSPAVAVLIQPRRALHAQLAFSEPGS